MSQIQHQLILAVLGKIPALHCLLQLAAGQIQIGGNIAELVACGDMNPAVEVPVSQLADMLRNLPEIAGIRLGEEEEEQQCQRNKKDQKKIQIADIADQKAEPGQRILGLNLRIIIYLQSLI
ncbi:hypothetical protein D3C81_1413270 [compost metagenome]